MPNNDMTFCLSHNCPHEGECARKEHPHGLFYAANFSSEPDCKFFKPNDKEKKDED